MTSPKMITSIKPPRLVKILDRAGERTICRTLDVEIQSCRAGLIIGDVRLCRLRVKGSAYSRPGASNKAASPVASNVLQDARRRGSDYPCDGGGTRRRTEPCA